MVRFSCIFNPEREGVYFNIQSSRFWGQTVITCTYSSIALSPKFKRVLLNETPEFPFWGLYFCVYFDLRDSTKWRI